MSRTLSQTLVPARGPQPNPAALEDERIWTRHWVCVGVEQQVPNPGDLLPATVGDHGLHVQRQPDGSLRAAFNVLQYGSCWTIPAQCGGGHKTRCPYVSCAHSLDTDALAAQDDGAPTPQMRQFTGFNPLKVLPVPLTTLGPFLFVCLDLHHPPSFGEEFGDLAAIVEESGLDRLEYVDRFGAGVDCHWALAGDALLAALGEVGGRPVSRAYCGFPNVIVVALPDHVAGVVVKPTRLDGAALVVNLFAASAGGHEAPPEDAGRTLVERWKRVCADAHLCSRNIGAEGASPTSQRARRLLERPPQ